jgi:hypothetical protein
MADRSILWAAKSGRIDRSIFVELKGGLVAIRKPEKRRRSTAQGLTGRAARRLWVSKKTLEAADCIILLTSLPTTSRRRRPQKNSAIQPASGPRPSSFVICNTPVEVSIYQPGVDCPCRPLKRR